VEKLPRDLEGDEGLACARRQRQQNTILLGGDRLQDPFDRDVLIVASRMRAALVFGRHHREAIPPPFGMLTGRVLLGSGP